MATALLNSTMTDSWMSTLRSVEERRLKVLVCTGVDALLRAATDKL